MEEVFTLLSDAFTKNTISYNPSLLEKVGDFVRRNLQRSGFREIKFEKPEDIFKFVVDFNYNYKNNAFGKAFKEFAKKGLLSANQITPDNVDNIGSMDANIQGLNEKVDALVGEKDADGNYKTTREEWSRRGIGKAYEQIIAGNMLDGLILSGYQGPTIYGQPKENFLEEIKYRKNGLADMLMKFNPEVNNSLIGWINSQLSKRKLDVESDFRIKLREAPITTEMERTQLGTNEIMEDFMEVQEDFNRIEKLIDASKIIGDTGKEFNRKIKDVDLYSLYFRNVPNLVSETLSEVTGLAENKILNPADNLSSAEFNSGRKYIYDNLKVILDILPEANVSEQASIEFAGKSTGVPKSLLEALYTKKEGKAGYEKTNISKEQALQAFGINPNGSNIEDLGPRSTEAQRVKAIISLIGKLATNTKIRQHMKKIGMPIKNIVDVEAGKSRFMMDVNLSERDKRFDNENITLFKTLVLSDKELTDLYTSKNVDEDLAIQILTRYGLSKNQALDLHRSLLNYSPKENIKRLIDNNTFIESYRNSLDYELYQKENAIKEQLDIVGEDLDVNSDAMRGRIIEQFIAPMLEKYIRSNIDSIKSQAAFIKLIYDNFYTINNAKVLNDEKKVVGTLQQENRVSLFKDNKEFSLFVNEILNKSNSKASLRFDSKDRLIIIKDTSTSRTVGQQSFTKVTEDQEKYGSIYGSISEQGSFVKSKTFRVGLDEFHNGTKDKQFILTAQNQETDKVKDVFKNFLLLLDDIKQDSFEKNGYKNTDAIDKKALASFMLLLSSKTHNYINYLYSVEDITRNENVPDKITKDQAKRFYKFKQNIPVDNVMKFMTLYMSDVNVDFASLNGLLSSLKGEFIPSDVKVRTIKKDIEALEKKEKEESKRIVEKVAPERAVAMTETEIRNRNLEDKLANLIAARDPRMTPGRVLDKVSALKQANYYNPKSGTIISPDVADYHSLIQVFYREGKDGEQDVKWFENNLNRKYTEATLKLDSKRQKLSENFKRVSKENSEAVKMLKNQTPFVGYINDDVLKVYLYYKAGHDIPGLEDSNLVNQMVKYVQRNPLLSKYGDDLMAIYPGQGKWIEPSANWQNMLIKEDVLNFVEKELRKEVFSEWTEIKDAVFSENNLNKILATYGKTYHRALVDMLKRMETGSSRSSQDTEAGRAVIQFLRGAVGVTMFFNARSAVLQTISTFNYIDLENNTVSDVYKRISDTKQFASDVAFIFNSDYLLQRRGGLRTDIQEQEIAQAVEKGGIRGFYKLLMTKGFLLTQLGDSAAISFLGATYYRTRVLKYLEDGKTQEQAEKEAFIDFYEKSEESQQSARPDRISRQQTTIGGRLFLAYQNTVLQYNRIVFRDIKDIIAGRGDKKKKLARIAYYTTVQNFMFSAAQQAWFYFLFGDDDEEQESVFDDRSLKLANGILDTIIRGFGIWGGIGSAVKNTILEGMKQLEKQESGGVRRSEYVLIQALNMSPILGAKARQGISAYNNIVDQRDLYGEMGFDLYNPALDAIGQVAAFANIPLNRIIQKTRNVEQALSEQDNFIKNFLYLAGWNTYDFRYKDEKLESEKARLKRIKKYKKSGSGVIINKSKKSDSKVISKKRVKR